jgi:hypothetical protein
MGGTTSVTLRKPDGEEFRMTRWTNSMPWGICNPRMFDANEKHMNEYLEQWLSMKEDYEKNHIGGNFEHNMTECYFPSAGLVPCGYGLTVVDHVNNVILDMQGYTSFDTVCVASVGLDINKVDDTHYSCNIEDDSSFTSFKEFLEAGRITGVQVADRSTNYGLQTIPLPSTDLQKLVPLIGNNYSSKESWYNFVLDTNPFTIETFEECNSLETARMYARLQELGFKFTDEENASWAEYIKEQKDEEEYEDD